MLFNAAADRYRAALQRTGTGPSTATAVRWVGRPDRISRSRAIHPFYDGGESQRPQKSDSVTLEDNDEPTWSHRQIKIPAYDRCVIHRAVRCRSSSETVDYAQMTRRRKTHMVIHN